MSINRRNRGKAKETVNVRLDPDLIRVLDRVAQMENSNRTTVIENILTDSPIVQWVSEIVEDEEHGEE